MNGLIVKPGETVSVNAVIGPRTSKNGFVPAPTIEEGEMVETVGGGISQFATTLYNALFYGGYDIIERQPHTYWFPRYPMGHEATLSYPKPDLIFRNDTEADCPAQMLIAFDAEITREDKDILESTDPDAVVDLRRRGVEFSMDSDRPGILIRRQLMAMLSAAGEAEVHR